MGAVAVVQGEGWPKEFLFAQASGTRIIKPKWLGWWDRCDHYLYGKTENESKEVAILAADMCNLRRSV
jgi:hypothetical protein